MTQSKWCRLYGWTMVAILFVLLTGTVRAQIPPTITLTPASVTATNTANVTFTATLTSGDTPATYAWYWIDTNNINWPLPQTTTNITIPLATAADGGSYYVIVSNDAGSTNSTTNTLTVFTPANVPVIQTDYSADYGFDPLNTTGDLLLGLTDPVSPAPAMTDGSATTTGLPAGTNFRVYGAGQNLTYDLYAPCNISEIDTYAGCADASNPNGNTMNQNYTISVSSDNGATYTNVLYIVQDKASLLYNDSAPADTQVQLVPNNGGQFLATNIDHIRFTFGNDLVSHNINGDYFEFMAYGTNTLTAGMPTITANVPASVQGTLGLPYSISVAAYGNPSPTFQWYLINAGATNALAGATNSTFTVAQAGLTNNLEKYLVAVSNSYGAITSSVSQVTLLGVVQTTNTIYSDTFGGRAGQCLIGTTPDTVDVGNTVWVGWSNVSQIYLDGSQLNLTNVEPVGGLYPNAYLPFTPAAGHVYTLSCSIRPLSGGSQWIALGYALTPVTNNYYASSTAGADWLLFRGNGTAYQVFAGPGTTAQQKYNGGNNFPAPGNTNVFETFGVVLDTTTGNGTGGWSMSIYTNGVLSYATNNVYSVNPAIRYVGLGADAATGNLKDFSLTDVSYSTVYPDLTVANQPGGQLTLTWPNAYTGWTLQSNSIGLLASNSWITVSGSTTTNQLPMTVDNSKTNVFFRLQSP